MDNPFPTHPRIPPNPPAKDNPQTTKPSHTWERNNLSNVSFPIPLNAQTVFPTKDTPGSPSFVEALKHGLYPKLANLDLFKYMYDNDIVDTTFLDPQNVVL